MQLGYVIFYVTDVPATLAFYESTFGLKRRFLHESNTYGELETGSTTLAFASEDMAKSNGLTVRFLRPQETSAAMELGLVTPDVPAAFQRAVQSGAIPVQPPKQKPWGQTVAYVKDLNGVLVELCSPMAT
ncbi:VOC family protein [Myxococcus stipitatus]|uniref:VOC family protein n=1 Tax=Myxococcus stipitatus TaxID=83455 RepID=UPI0030CFA3E7